LDGQETQHLLFIENDGTYRTNLGIAASAPALAAVSVRDASGHEIESHLLGTDGGIAQVAVSSHVSGGRAVVRILSGDARGYASLIDTRSGDATFVAGR
ncbi:MAG TPA: hypothetical protein VF701_15465, partial [Thermoanaerobaculia bacterium]